MKKAPRDPVLSLIASLLGKRGAAVTNAKLTKAQRRDRARRAVAERWRRCRERKKKEGEL